MWKGAWSGEGRGPKTGFGRRRGLGVAGALGWIPFTFLVGTRGAQNVWRRKTSTFLGVHGRAWRALVPNTQERHLARGGRVSYRASAVQLGSDGPETVLRVAIWHVCPGNSRLAWSSGYGCPIAERSPLSGLDIGGKKSGYLSCLPRINTHRRHASTRGRASVARATRRTKRTIPGAVAGGPPVGCPAPTASGFPIIGLGFSGVALGVSPFASRRPVAVKRGLSL